MHHPCLHDSKRCPGTHESWIASDLGGKFDITWHFSILSDDESDTIQNNVD